jgi:hypothetical protein
VERRELHRVEAFGGAVLKAGLCSSVDVAAKAVANRPAERFTSVAALPPGQMAIVPLLPGELPVTDGELEVTGALG